jgi:hypothetical protein
MDEVLRSHCVASEELRANRFWEFYAARAEALYQTAETLTHRRHRPRLSEAPISRWTTVRFCNGVPHGVMSQGLRVLVLLQRIEAATARSSRASRTCSGSASWQRRTMRAGRVGGRGTA